MGSGSVQWAGNHKALIDATDRELGKADGCEVSGLMRVAPHVFVRDRAGQRRNLC